MKSTIIPKEFLNSYTFLKEDVLKTEESKIIRASKLEKALKLGNVYHRKVRILFRTMDSLSKMVETTVWFVSGEYVSLKGGVFLPVRAIEDVDFA